MPVNGEQLAQSTKAPGALPLDTGDEAKGDQMPKQCLGNTDGDRGGRVRWLRMVMGGTEYTHGLPRGSTQTKPVLQQKLRILSSPLPWSLILEVI